MNLEFLSEIEERRVLRLDGDPERVRFAPAVHAEHIDPVLHVVDQSPECAEDVRKVRLRKKTFIHRFLPARGVAFEEMVHMLQPPVVAHVVCHEIEVPAHAGIIARNDVSVSHDNLVISLKAGAGSPRVKSHQSGIKSQNKRNIQLSKTTRLDFHAPTHIMSAYNRGANYACDSVWIEFFKQRSATGDTLEALILEDSIWVCGGVLFELVQGVKSDNERLQIQTTLSHLKYAEMSKSLWQKAGDLSSSLRKKGLTIPLSDIFIAAVAIEHKLRIFTLDGHFADIPGVKIYKIG